MSIIGVCLKMSIGLADLDEHALVGGWACPCRTVHSLNTPYMPMTRACWEQRLTLEGHKLGQSGI